MLTVSQLPPNKELLEPVQLVGGWEYPKHPNISRLQRDAEKTIVTLEFLSRIECFVEPSFVDDQEQGERLQEQEDDNLRAKLEILRFAHGMLQGPAIRRVRRDVERHVPQLLDRLDSAVQAAVEQLAELRAVTAFLLGENDDEELGIEIIPPQEAPRSPAPSQKFEL